MRAEEVVSGGKDLDSKIPPLGAKGWGTGKSNPSHPSQGRRRVGHPQNLRFNCVMELLAVDQPSVGDTEDAKKEGRVTRLENLLSRRRRLSGVWPQQHLFVSRFESSPDFVDLPSQRLPTAVWRTELEKRRPIVGNDQTAETGPAWLLQSIV
jgi:hypothetical protein